MVRLKHRRSRAEDLPVLSSKDRIARLKYAVSPDKRSEAVFNVDEAFRFTSSVTVAGVRYESQMVPKLGPAADEHERLALELGRPLVIALAARIDPLCRPRSSRMQQTGQAPRRATEAEVTWDRRTRRAGLLA